MTSKITLESLAQRNYHFLSVEPLTDTLSKAPSNQTQSPPEDLPMNTLEELKQKYCTCMNCPLGETRNNFVFC